MTQKLVDGVLVDLTPEEQAEYDYLQAHPPPDPTPALTEAQLQRIRDLFEDSDLQDIMTRLATNDVATIRSYLNSAITDLPTAKAMLIKTILVLAYLIQKRREVS